MSCKHQHREGRPPRAQQLYERELHKTLSSRLSTSSGVTSAPPSQSTLLSKIHLSLAWMSSNSTVTASNTPSTPSAKWNDLGRIRFLSHGGEVAATYLLDGLLDPRSPPNSQANARLYMQLTRQLKTYRIEDPPVKR